MVLRRSELRAILQEPFDTFDVTIAPKMNFFRTLLPESEAMKNGLKLANQILSNEFSRSALSYHLLSFEEVSNEPHFVDEEALRRSKNVGDFLADKTFNIEQEEGLRTDRNKPAFAVYDRRFRNIMLNAEFLRRAAQPRDERQLALLSFLIGVKLVHEVGHAAFFIESAQGDISLHSPDGAMKEESGFAVEINLFGGELFAYGAKSDIFDVRHIVFHSVTGRSTRLVPIAYLTKFFNNSFWTGVDSIKSLRLNVREAVNVLSSPSSYGLKGASASETDLDELGNLFENAREPYRKI